MRQCCRKLHGPAKHGSCRFACEDKGRPHRLALEEEFSSHSEIRDLNVPDANRLAGTLSGGNVQRMTFARAVISNPSVLVACYPSRGLDVATVAVVHETLLRLRNGGAAVLLISEDLPELFELSDELLVLSRTSRIWSVRRQYRRSQ